MLMNIYINVSKSLYRLVRIPESVSCVRPSSCRRRRTVCSFLALLLMLDYTFFSLDIILSLSAIVEVVVEVLGIACKMWRKSLAQGTQILPPLHPIHQSIDLTNVHPTKHPAARASVRAIGRQAAHALLALLFHRSKDVPEAQSLICGRAHDLSAVRGCRHVQHASSVAGQLLDLRHRRVLPKAELVLRETVARQKLLLALAPHKRANLRPGVDRVEVSAVGSVPKLDRSVCRSSAAREDVTLEWAPR